MFKQTRDIHAYMYATSEGYQVVVKFLLEVGINVNV